MHVHQLLFLSLNIAELNIGIDHQLPDALVLQQWTVMVVWPHSHLHIYHHHSAAPSSSNKYWFLPSYSIGGR